MPLAHLEVKRWHVKDRTDVNVAPLNTLTLALHA